MSEPLVRDIKPAEYFRDLVKLALHRQRVETWEQTEFYLVDLLTRFVDPRTRSMYAGRPEALALQLDRALDAPEFEQAVRLRNLADSTLLVSGFFSDSLKQAAVDIDYQVGIGRMAYATLANNRKSRLRDVYFELCRKFVPFVDVLLDVSEQTTTHSHMDRYRWNEIRMLIGSRYALAKSISMGFVPARKRTLQ